MAVLLGEQRTKAQYVICVMVAYLVLPVAASMGVIAWTALLAWLSLPLAIRTTRVVLNQQGRPLNAALAGTGQTALLFSLLFWIGLTFT